MENLVVTLKTAKKLKAAGFPQKTGMIWSPWTDLHKQTQHELVRLLKRKHAGYIAAPSAQEIADQLRAEGYIWNMTAHQSRYEVAPFRVYPVVWAETMVAALAMLWLAPQEADNGSK